MRREETDAGQRPRQMKIGQRRKTKKTTGRLCEGKYERNSSEGRGCTGREGMEKSDPYRQPL